MQIAAGQVTPQLRALFDPGQPIAIRCFAVLDGSIAGRIWVDDPDRPAWGAVQEAVFGTLFLGGRPKAGQVHRLVEEWRRDQDVAVGLWPGHEHLDLLPPEPDFEGWDLDFTDRPLGAGLDPFLYVPDGFELRAIDATWLERCRFRDYYVGSYGSAERTLQNGFGYCLLQGDELASEAFASNAALGTIEIGTITGEPYRHQGLATVTCAHLIRECEARGYRTYWNCARDNLPSAALARKLGYRSEKEFRLMVWYGPDS